MAGRLLARHGAVSKAEREHEGEPWKISTELEAEDPRVGHGRISFDKTMEHLRERGDKRVMIGGAFAPAGLEWRWVNLR